MAALGEFRLHRLGSIQLHSNSNGRLEFDDEAEQVFEEAQDFEESRELVNKKHKTRVKPSY